MLPAPDRALWATALYAGLRRGELMALDWDAVDLKSGVMRVSRSWDPVAHVMGAPKSRAGTRAVPIASALRGILLEHHIASDRPSAGLVFGRQDGQPFTDTALGRRTKKTWGDAGHSAITLHEARHTFASLMIAAGVNATALSTYMGHSSVTITYDRYGHLMPGNESEAATLLDAYLERRTVPQTVPRVAQPAL